jgi:hypothetical protein
MGAVVKSYWISTLLNPADVFSRVGSGIVDLAAGFGSDCRRRGHTWDAFEDYR